MLGYGSSYPSNNYTNSIGGFGFGDNYGSMDPYGMGGGGYSMGAPAPMPMTSGPAPGASLSPNTGYSSPQGAALGGATPAAVADVADKVGAGSGFGMNLDTFKTLSNVIGSFGQIYSGIQMNKIAKQSLAFQKESYTKNLANQIKTYNTSLDARAASSGIQNNRSQADTDALIAKNRL